LLEVIVFVEQVLQRVEELECILELILAANCPPSAPQNAASESDLHPLSHTDQSSTHATPDAIKVENSKVHLASALIPALKVLPLSASSSLSNAWSPPCRQRLPQLTCHASAQEVS
jgi:hypothetical protein